MVSYLQQWRREQDVDEGKKATERLQSSHIDHFACRCIMNIATTECMYNFDVYLNASHDTIHDTDNCTMMRYVVRGTYSAVAKKNCQAIEKSRSSFHSVQPS